MWPTKIRAYAQLQKIAQIGYTLQPGESYIRVYKVNTYEANPTWTRYEHTVPLATYYPLSLLIWRLRCLSDIFNAKRYSKTTIHPMLKRYLQYLDDTLDYIWGECLAHGTPYNDWWPPSLLRWASIELNVGRHSSRFIEDWKGTRRRAVPPFLPLQLGELKKKVAASFPSFRGPFKNKLKWEELSVAEQRWMRIEVSKWLAIEGGAF